MQCTHMNKNSKNKKYNEHIIKCEIFLSFPNLPSRHMYSPEGTNFTFLKFLLLFIIGKYFFKTPSQILSSGEN